MSEYYCSMDSHVKWDKVNIEEKNGHVWVHMNRSCLKLTLEQAQEICHGLNEVVFGMIRTNKEATK